MRKTQPLHATMRPMFSIFWFCAQQAFLMNSRKAAGDYAALYSGKAEEKL